MKINPLHHNCEIQSFLNIIGQEYPSFPTKYLNMASNLGMSPLSIIKCLPDRALNAWVSGVESATELALRNSENSAYWDSYKIIHRFINMLVAPCINEYRLRVTAADMQNLGAADKALEFLPLKTGRAYSTTYSTNGTVTGRLTVVDGPNPLTMPPTVKACLTSSFDGGQVLQLDIVAAEPRTALNVMGIDVSGDVYDHVSRILFDGELSRVTCKQATICALYGQSASNLSKLLPVGVNAHEIISGVRNFFQSANLVEKIRLESKNGIMRNALGRPLKMPENPNMLVSHYLQSSAAEISILLFEKFCRAFEEQVTPLYIIHDALLIDCVPNAAAALLERGVLRLRMNDWFYDVKVSTIS